MRVVGRTGNLLVVGLDDGGWGEHEGGARVGNAVEVAAVDGRAGADGVAGGGEAPETLRVVDVGVGDGAVVAGGDDGAEVVGAGGVVLEAGGHESLGQTLGDGVGQEGLGRGRGDGVDAVEGETDETVARAGGELAGGGGGSLNSLAGDGDAADVDGVAVDGAGGAGTITVGDLPARARLLLGRTGGEVGVATTVAGEALAQDPEVGGAGVEVKLEGLAANGDGAEVFGVAVDR